MWYLHCLEVLALVPGIISAVRLARRRIRRLASGRPQRPARLIVAASVRPQLSASILHDPSRGPLRQFDARHWARIAFILEQPIGHAQDASGLQQKAQIQVDAAETMLRRLLEDTVAVSDYARRRVAEGWPTVPSVAGDSRASAA